MDTGNSKTTVILLQKNYFRHFVKCALKALGHCPQGTIAKGKFKEIFQDLWSEHAIIIIGTLKTPERR